MLSIFVNTLFNLSIDRYNNIIYTSFDHLHTHKHAYPPPPPPPPPTHTHTHPHTHATLLLSGHPLLQLRVIACFLILVGGRVINVYVPIYYKKIINALTPNQQTNTTSYLDLALGFTHPATGITFPIASILIYILLRFLQVHTSVLPCCVHDIVHGASTIIVILLNTKYSRCSIIL